MSKTSRSNTPVSFTRRSGEIVIEDEESAPKRRTAATGSLPQVDSCILELKTLEQRDRFTLYKIRVNNNGQSWIIYRRYSDFVLLNKKLRRLFPQFRLNLPGKRYILNNFATDFIQKRQRGLEDFMRNVLIHRDIAFSDPVQRFFRLDNPPRPNESLEASQRYCQSLEVSLADARQQLQEQNIELRSLKLEVEREKYHKDESRDLEKHLQQQNASVEEMTKSLSDQLKVSQENEQRAREDVERIREEIKAERASAAAARTIERQRRETLLNRDLGNLRKSQETVNQRVDNIVMAVTKLTKVEVKAAGRTIELDPSAEQAEQVVELRKAIAEARSQLDSIYQNSLEMYKEENVSLKAELTRSISQVEARTSENETIRRQMEEQCQTFTQGFQEQDNYIQKLRQSFSELQQLAINTEEKYFYALVIGVKLNMMACGVWREEHVNKLKPHLLFERVREHGISIEHWPSWVSRELATF